MEGWSGWTDRCWMLDALIFEPPYVGCYQVTSALAISSERRWEGYAYPPSPPLGAVTPLQAR